MLLELVVENYAVVERLRVHFHAGLNLLTGETGSGKSIVVDALGLLLGGRASADMVRTGEARARVAGIFDVKDHAGVRRLLEPAGLEIEDGELLVEREILASGKSRAFVGSRPVAASLLKDLAPHLADIHGQHDQQLLFSADAQREMLDAFAGNRELLDRVGRGLRRSGARAAAELEELERSEQEKLRLLDLWSFQRKEIENAGLAPDEEAALENERRVLQNVQRLQGRGRRRVRGGVRESRIGALADARGRQARRRAVPHRFLARRPSRASESGRSRPPGGLVRAARLPLGAGGQPRAAGGGRDPAGGDRQAEAQVRRLDRRRSWRFSRRFASRSPRSNTPASAWSSCAPRRRSSRSEFEAIAAELTERRTAAARKLEKRVEAELAQLAMERTTFRIAISRAEWSADGADRVEFLVSPNLGEEPRPWKRSRPAARSRASRWR